MEPSLKPNYQIILQQLYSDQWGWPMTESPALLLKYKLFLIAKAAACDTCIREGQRQPFLSPTNDICIIWSAHTRNSCEAYHLMCKSVFRVEDISYFEESEPEHVMSRRERIQLYIQHLSMLVAPGSSGSMVCVQLMSEPCSPPRTPTTCMPALQKSPCSALSARAAHREDSLPSTVVPLRKLPSAANPAASLAQQSEPAVEEGVVPKKRRYTLVSPPSNESSSSAKSISSPLPATANVSAALQGDFDELIEMDDVFAGVPAEFMQTGVPPWGYAWKILEKEEGWGWVYPVGKVAKKLSTYWYVRPHAFKRLKAKEITRDQLVEDEDYFSHQNDVLRYLRAKVIEMKQAL